MTKCAGPGCFKLPDPRWGGFCDGHGVSTDAERQNLLDGWRAQNQRLAEIKALLDDVREYLLECKRDSYNNQLLARINEALEPQPQTEASRD